jgi:hypothetical protein
VEQAGGRKGKSELTNPTSSNRLGNHHIPFLNTRLVTIHRMSLTMAMAMKTPIKPSTPILR